MRQKKLTKHPECQRCGASEETVNHLLFFCPFARLVWAASPLGFLYYPDPTYSIFTNMAAGLLSHPDDDEETRERKKLWPWMLWRLWKSRNALCFSNQQQDVQYVLDQSRRDKEEWEAAATNTVPPDPPPTSIPRRPVRWEPLPPGMLKCNVDASWHKDRDSCAIGWILRGHLGNLRWYGAKVYPKLLSCLEAEATRLVWAMQCLDNLGLERVYFETDSSIMIKALQDPQSWPCLTAFTDDILSPRRFLIPSFSYIGRAGNKCADKIASHVSFGRMYEAVLDCSVPHWLYPFVETEKPCLGS